MIKERIYNLYLQVSIIYKILMWKPQRKGAMSETGTNRNREKYGSVRTEVK